MTPKFLCELGSELRSSLLVWQAPHGLSHLSIIPFPSLFFALINDMPFLQVSIENIFNSLSFLYLFTQIY